MPSSRKKTGRTYRSAVARDELPKVFHRKVAADETFTPLLERFHATGADSDRDALILHLLPMASQLASRHHKNMFLAKHLDDLDVLLSDAYIVLFDVVNRYHAMPANRFLQLAHAVMRQGFAAGYRERNGANLASDRDKLMGSFAQKFVREHGRTPNTDERQAYIATVITNPAMLVRKPRPRPIAFSALKAEGESDSRCNFYVDHRVSAAPLIDRDTMDFAMKSLIGLDRKIFKLALEGVGPTEIGRLFGMSKNAAMQRTNAILWQARCRCDLARAMGVEPAREVQLNANRQPVSMKNVPPARLVG